MILDFAIQTGLGYRLFGLALRFNDRDSVTAATQIIQGDYDIPLKCALYHKTFKKIAKDEAMIEHAEVLNSLKRVKAHFRDEIQHVFRLIEEAEIAAKKKAKESLINKLKETNKPAEYGTVAEIAARYCISKSEVRRLKQEGKLDEFIAQAALPQTV